MNGENRRSGHDLISLGSGIGAPGESLNALAGDFDQAFSYFVLTSWNLCSPMPIFAI